MLNQLATKFNNLGIGTRLIGGFLLLALACAAVGFWGARSMNQINQSVENANGNLIPSLRVLTDLRESVGTIQRTERTLIMSARAKNGAMRQQAATWQDAAWVKLRDAAKRYESYPMADKEKQMWAEFQPRLDEFRRDHEATMAALKAGDAERAEQLCFASMPNATKMNEALSALCDLQGELSDQEARAAQEQYASARATMFAVIGGAVTVAVLLGVFFRRLVVRPLEATNRILQAVAAGDLTKTAVVSAKDEFGQMAAALNVAIGALVLAKETERAQVEKDRERAERDAAAKREEDAAKQEQADREAAAAAELRRKVGTIIVSVNAMAAGDFTASVPDLGTDDVGQMGHSLNQAIGSVRATLEGVREVSEQLADASVQLSAASEEISTGAQEQASSLEETASTLEEITVTVKQNADNAQQARQLASGSRDVAEKGGGVVSSAIDAMSEINASSKKIADIITTIDEIAFQTNLLALNAAVEAARAGEQGRGFAVVAAEVRNLAQRSATAAKEIKSLISDSVKKVDAGTDLVNRSGATLGEIVTSVKRVTDIITEIAAAGREQSTGIEQVNKAVSQMDTVTQRNASQTEEMSATAQTLTDQAAQLRDLVARFKLSTSHEHRAPARPAPRPVKRTGAKPRPAVARALSNGSSSTNGHDLDALGDSTGFTEF